MTFRKVIRFLAVCSIVGGFFRAIMTPFALVWGANSTPELVAGALGTLFMGMGMFGLYFMHIKEMGKLGFMAFTLHSICSFILMAMVFSSLVFKFYDPSMMESDTPPLPIMVAGIVMMPLLIGSMILFAISVWKSKVMSIIPAILLLLTPIINFVPGISDFGPLLWGLSFMLFGIEVWNKMSVRKTYANLDMEGAVSVRED